jgi:HK97 family phage prohead protease
MRSTVQRRKPSPTTHLITRLATIAPASINLEARTVDVVWTTGAKVLRGFFEQFYEELSLEPRHIRMGRLTSGRAPLLASHDRFNLRSVIGVVDSARLEKAQGIATVRFAKEDPDADAVWNKIAQRILTNVSVGYQVYRYEKSEDIDEKIPTRVAVDWEPWEISVVSVGADAGSQVRSHDHTLEQSMDDDELSIELEQQQQRAPAPAPGRRGNRLAQLIELACRQGLPMSEGLEIQQRAISGNMPELQVRTLLLERLAARDDSLTGAGGPNRADLRGGDEPDSRVPLMAEALAARFGGPAPSEEARQYIRLSVVDFAANLLEARGISTRMMSRSAIIERGMHTTSDFPALLTETGNRFLRRGYNNYPGGAIQISRSSTNPDFRAKSHIQFGEAPTLLKVNEHGEFKSGTMAEAKESYRLETFGRIVGISRQALVNDDLGAFTDVTGRMGRMAREFCALQIVNLLTSNPVLNDGVVLFHATHKNLGTAAVISIASLGEGLKLMRLQKGLDGVTVIDVTPKWLIVPAALEVVAKQFVTVIQAEKSSEVNPFASELEVIVDPRLDAASAISWYLSADPNVIDTIEHSFLDTVDGPEIIMMEGFRVDGMEVKVRLDFGCGVLDHRGLFKNPGA